VVCHLGNSLTLFPMCMMPQIATFRLVSDLCVTLFFVVGFGFRISLIVLFALMCVLTS
jgi:hypothetical protein